MLGTATVAVRRGRRRCAETFFATLTKELRLGHAPKQGWTTRAEVRSAIFEFLEGFYIPTRRNPRSGRLPRSSSKPTNAAGDPDGLARANTRAAAR
jgi:hypothetical protein